jgi:hypothetical protein
MAGAANHKLHQAWTAKRAGWGIDHGMLMFTGDKFDAAVSTFIEGLKKHRHFERETCPSLGASRS